MKNTSGGLIALTICFGVISGYATWRFLPNYRNQLGVYIPSTKAKSAERDSVTFFHPDSPCGAVAVSVACKFLDNKTIDMFRCTKDLGSVGSGLASAKAISDVLQNYGYASKAVKFGQGYFDGIADEALLIVHLRSEHWAVVANLDERLVLIDPPFEPRLFFGVKDKWDGIAVVVATKSKTIDVFVTEDHAKHIIK